MSKEEIVFDLLSYSGLVVLFLAIIAGCLYASLWLFGKILKMTGNWKDTYGVMIVYFSMKRGDKSFKYKGNIYRKESK